MKEPTVELLQEINGGVQRRYRVSTFSLEGQSNIKRFRLDEPELQQIKMACPHCGALCVVWIDNISYPCFGARKEDSFYCEECDVTTEIDYVVDVKIRVFEKIEEEPVVGNRRVIEISNCEECPFLSAVYKTADSVDWDCGKSGYKRIVSHLRDQEERPPIPKWCPLQKTKESKG